MSRARQALKPNSIPITYPDQLSESDLALFVPAFQNVQAAQVRLQIAEKEFQTARVAHIEAQGAINYIASLFKSRYGLDGHETIDLTGKIHR